MQKPMESGCRWSRIGNPTTHTKKEVVKTLTALLTDGMWSRMIILNYSRRHNL